MCPNLLNSTIFCLEMSKSQAVFALLKGSMPQHRHGTDCVLVFTMLLPMRLPFGIVSMLGQTQLSEGCPFMRGLVPRCRFVGRALYDW